MEIYADNQRLPGDDPLIEELAYLSSKLDSLERELRVRRRDASRRSGLSTIVVAVVAIAALVAARFAAQAATVDLVSWHTAIAGAVLAALAAAAAAAFAARGAVRGLVGYVVDAVAQPAPEVSVRDNAVTAALASLVIFGLYLDGWRHINLADNRAAAFLTWWHLPLYVGATVTGLWITTRHQRVRDILRGRFDLAAVPAGYRLGLCGMALLTSGAAGDAVWHTFYGIEQGIERTMSPFHIALFTAATLILSCPLRAAWYRRGDDAPRFGAFFPALLSLTLTTAAISFIVQFLVAFLLWTKPVPDIAALGAAGENTRIVGTATVLVSNALLFAPILFAMRRWRLPFGSATFLFTSISLVESSMVELKHGATLAAPFLAGLVADALAARFRATPQRPAAQRLVAGIAPVVLWTAYFGILRYVYGVVWERNIWLSATLLAGLSGLLLSALLSPAIPALAAATAEHEGDVEILDEHRHAA